MLINLDKNADGDSNETKRKRGRPRKDGKFSNHKNLTTDSKRYLIKI